MIYHKTKYGKIVLGDAFSICKKIKSNTIDLIITSPPYALLRKKKYGNVEQSEYVDWFIPIAKEIYRILKPQGSFVLNIGSAWNKGTPTKSVYQYELLLKLIKINFFLAQECYWYKPVVMPSPAEWVTIRKIRLKEAIEHIFWLSKTPFPAANNQEVLVPYSKAMLNKLNNKNLYTGLRPSGHSVNNTFAKKRKGAIASNTLIISNTASNNKYLQYCKQNQIKPHPARFPEKIPYFFIKMLTKKYDTVLDPFAGSCTTGVVAESLKRYWVCIDNEENYLKGALGRFTD